MLLLSASLLCGLVLLSGCAMYVNIPPEPHSTARHDPNIPTVIETMGRSVEAVTQRFPSDERWQLELPAGATAETYATVAAWAADRITADEALGMEVALSVQAVRIFGTTAEVDLLRPMRGSPRQLVTVYLRKQPFAPWRVQRVRPWMLPTDEPQD